MTDALEHGQLILARKQPEGSGYVLAYWDAKHESPATICDFSETAMDELHQLVHQVRGNEQAEDGVAEAPEYTDEEVVINNLWDLGRYAAEIEKLEVGRRHLVAAIKQVELNPTRETIAAHPLVKLTDDRRKELRRLISELI
jgi:hypothetical protein